jgi:hypothetical protein
LGGSNEEPLQHRAIRQCRRSDSFEMMDDGWWVLTEQQLKTYSTVSYRVQSCSYFFVLDMKFVWFVDSVAVCCHTDLKRIGCAISVSRAFCLSLMHFLHSFNVLLRILFHNSIIWLSPHFGLRHSQRLTNQYCRENWKRNLKLLLKHHPKLTFKWIRCEQIRVPPIPNMGKISHPYDEPSLRTLNVLRELEYPLHIEST